MTEAQWQAIDQYVAQIQQQLRLGSYRFIVKREYAPAEAQVQARTLYKTSALEGAIELDAGFEKESPAEQQNTLIHELLHAPFRRQDRVFERLERYVPPAVWETMREAYNEEQDTGIDSLAWALMPHMPGFTLPAGDASDAPPQPESSPENTVVVTQSDVGEG